MKEVDKIRRDILIKALSAGLCAAGFSGLMPPVWAMGKIPTQLVPGKSIYELEGTVRVNGKLANESTLIDSGATVETGAKSHVIFVVGIDAFILRSDSKVILQGSNKLINSLRLISGKLLSVFGQREEKKQKLNIETITATIGIRGTGVYVESEVDQTYVCTCYGVADIASKKDKSSKERVVTKHHDSPRYIRSKNPNGKQIVMAPVINHTDDELALIEALVGRSVPFSSSGYSAPRKSSY